MIHITLLVVESMLLMVNRDWKLIFMVSILRDIPALQLSIRAASSLYQLAKPSWRCSSPRSTDDNLDCTEDSLLKMRSISSCLVLLILSSPRSWAENITLRE